MREKVEPLKDDANLLPKPAELGIQIARRRLIVPIKSDVTHLYIAAVKELQAVQTAQERRLPASGRADDHRQLGA